MSPELVLAHAGRPGASPWDWHLHPDVLLVMGALVAAYVGAFRVLGPRLAMDSPAVSRRQLVLVATGVGMLWLVSDWPVHDLAEGPSYTVHMVQHAVYTLVVPPMLILGTPTWLWRWLLRPVMPVIRLATRPVVAILVFSTVSVAAHLPAFVTAAVQSGPAHFGQHLALVVAAFLVWWPLASPVSEVPRLADPRHQMVYLFFLSLAPSVAGSFIIWAQEPPYQVYEQFPRVFGHETLEDQRLGGVVMGVVEATVVFGLMAVIALRLFLREVRQAQTTTDTEPAHTSARVDRA